MPASEIIAIGTEILLGEIVDTNTRVIARRLRDLGIDVYRQTTVGDNSQRIAQAIRQALESSEIVITTGGLGPTVDDPTREAVALAMRVETEFRPELWEQIQARFQRFGRLPTENNRRQAFVPVGSIAVENPVGTAPAFIFEKCHQTVISLPGVPSEMEFLLEKAILPYLRQRFQLKGIIKARVLHTAGVGESQIDALIGDLEQLTNPTVGLAAHSGQVDVRITAKAESETIADELISGVEAELRKRLVEWVYGVDQETLEEAALRAIHRHGWKLGVVELGAGGELIRRLAAASQNKEQAFSSTFRCGEVIIESPAPSELFAIAETYRKERRVEICLCMATYPTAEKQDVHLVIVTPEGQQQVLRPYGGPPEYAPRWARHHALDLLRRL